MQVVVGGKWTSDEEVEGWRHFEVVTVEGRGRARVVELAATCDPRRRVKVPLAALARRDGWSPGWRRL